MQSYFLPVASISEKVRTLSQWIQLIIDESLPLSIIEKEIIQTVQGGRRICFQPGDIKDNTVRHGRCRRKKNKQ